MLKPYMNLHKQNFQELKKLKKLLPFEIVEKYLIERSFIQTVLATIIAEVTNKFNSKVDKLLEVFGLTQVEAVKEKLAELKNNIEDNRYLEKIEIPILQTIKTTKKDSDEKK